MNDNEQAILTIPIRFCRQARPFQRSHACNNQHVQIINFKIKTTMRQRSAQWFETKVRYDKTMEDGNQKKVTETYIVDALSFGEAEARITKEMLHYISGEFEVKTITPTPYGEIWFSDSATDDHFYLVKLDFITIDEKTDKEKRSTVPYLVQAGSLDGARINAEVVMGGSMVDYVFKSIKETSILDIFEHTGSQNNSTQSQNKK